MADAAGAPSQVKGDAATVEFIWLAFGQVVLPTLVGMCTMVLARRRARLWESPPSGTAFVLYILLLVLTALAAAGYDMWTPMIGGIVSLAVAIAVFIVLRRRMLVAARDQVWRSS